MRESEKAWAWKERNWSSGKSRQLPLDAEKKGMCNKGRWEITVTMRNAFDNSLAFIHCVCMGTAYCPLKLQLFIHLFMPFLVPNKNNHKKNFPSLFCRHFLFYCQKAFFSLLSKNVRMVKQNSCYIFPL